MRIFALPPRENWICDRFVNEWNDNNLKTYTNHPDNADIIWLLADWCWNQIPKSYLENKKVCASVHHLVPEKFGWEEMKEWVERDKFIDFYHVPCEKTRDQIKNITKKPIYTFPFWTNSKMWKKEDKAVARKALKLPQNKFIIGSFQRDTEGSDLVSPKLEKGPDLLADKIIEIHKKQEKEVHVLLGGWRRQYLINRLEKENVPFTYIQLPNNQILNTMYNSLDLYMVTARYEGGPQAIVECGLTKTPIISTDVGLASELMSEKSVRDFELLEQAVPDVESLYKNCLEISIENKGMDPFREMFEKELK